MSWLAVIKVLIFNAPEVLGLIRAIIEKAEEAERKEKVKDDFRAIEQAFKNKDSDALRRIFESK
jgi:hypothetical protein